MTTSPLFPEQLLKQTAWLQRLSRELAVDAHAAADLAQDTLTAALVSPAPNRASIRTWLERIARNLAAGNMRARHRRLRREQQTVVGDTEPSTADTIAQFELHRSVVAAVQRLREPMRTTLLLRFWEDLPPREIAKRMGTPVETVRTRIKRGLHELRGSLDSEHGRRGAWCLPLLTLSTSQIATIATTATPGLAVFSFGTLMKAKSLALSVVTLFAIATAFVWSFRTPDPDASPPSSVTNVAVAAGTEDPLTGTTEVQREAVAPNSQNGDAPADQTLAWIEGIVTDEFSAPLADVEVALLTQTEADSYRRYTESDLSAEDLHFERVRWTLWHLSEKGWIAQKAVLREAFGVDLIARTNDSGSFRIRPQAAGEPSIAPSVVAIWSPVVGLRFHTFASLQDPLHIACERWPHIRGDLAIAGGQQQAVAIEVDTGIQEPARVLVFQAQAPGTFETPQIPPGSKHSIQMRAAGHQLERQQFDLFADTSIRAKLVPHPQLHARLLDAAGNLLDTRSLTALGWQPQELQFLLLREDFANDAALGLDMHPHSSMQFTADEGQLHGSIEDLEARVLSVWSGKQRVAAAPLPNHRIDEVAVDLPLPLPATTLHVEVAFATQATPAESIDLWLGNMVGLGGYSFALATKTTGPAGSFALEVPSFLRGQTARLIIMADGFASQLVDVDVPLADAPVSIRVTLPQANYTLLGRVEDEHGKPLRGARVKIATPEGIVFRTQPETIHTTDDNGAFTFDGLSARSVRLFVAHREYAATSALASVGEPDPVTIRMSPGIERTLQLGSADDPAVMVRILNVLGEPLMDDRVFGAMHGQMTRIRLANEAHTLETWRPGASTPVRVMPLR